MLFCQIITEYVIYLENNVFVSHSGPGDWFPRMHHWWTSLLSWSQILRACLHLLGICTLAGRGGSACKDGWADYLWNTWDTTRYGQYVGGMNRTFLLYYITRTYFSRMQTTRLPNSMGYIKSDGWTDRHTDRHDWKHYLPAYAGGNYISPE